MRRERGVKETGEKVGFEGSNEVVGQWLTSTPKRERYQDNLQLVQPILLCQSRVDHLSKKTVGSWRWLVVLRC